MSVAIVRVALEIPSSHANQASARLTPSLRRPAPSTLSFCRPLHVPPPAPPRLLSPCYCRVTMPITLIQPLPMPAPTAIHIGALQLMLGRRCGMIVDRKL